MIDTNLPIGVETQLDAESKTRFRKDIRDKINEMNDKRQLERSNLEKKI